MKFSAADLLRAGKSERMSDPSRVRLADSVCVALVAGATVTSAGAGSAGSGAGLAKASAAGSFKLFAAAAVALTVGGGLVIGLVGWPAPDALSPPPPVATRIARSPAASDSNGDPHRRSQMQGLAASVEPGSRGLRTLRQPEAPAPSSSATIATRPSSAQGAATQPATAAALVESEAASLAAVRDQLRGGHPNEALTLLAEHARKFPGGQLAVEARVLRIRALSKTDPERAKSEARAFLRAQPNNPYRSELERMVEK